MMGYAKRESFRQFWKRRLSRASRLSYQLAVWVPHAHAHTPSDTQNTDTSAG